MIKPTFLISIPGVLSVLFLASISIAQPYETNAQGDYAWFPDDPNILRLVDGTTRISKVCRWRSQKGNCYALTHIDAGGDMPVFLKTQAEFQSWLDAADRQANWDYCETIDNPWSAWAGTAPTACGSHTYTQTSTCSVAGKADKPCPDTCPQTSRSRTVTVNNATCVAACVPNWTPPQSDYPSTVTFTQNDGCGKIKENVRGTGGPVDGICGSVKNTCSAGTFANPRALGGAAGPGGRTDGWASYAAWDCQGLRGGTTQTYCLKQTAGAVRKDGSCGSAHQATTFNDCVSCVSSRFINSQFCSSGSVTKLAGFHGGVGSAWFNWQCTGQNGGRLSSTCTHYVEGGE